MLITSKKYFTTLDSLAGLPKNGFINGIERTDGIGRTQHYMIGMPTLINGKYSLQDGTILEEISGLQKKLNLLKDEEKNEVESIIAELQRIDAEDIEERLTEEEALAAGYIVDIKNMV